MWWIEDQRPAVRLALGTGQPVVAVGAVVAAGWTYGHRPDGWPGSVASIGLFVIVGVLWLSSLAVTNASGVGFLSCMVLLAAIWMAYQAVEAGVLEERGVTVRCTILDVEHRVERSTDGDGSTSSTDYYDHRLDCVGGRPDEMTTTGWAAGERNEVLRVAYDPRGRLRSRPAADVVSSRIYVWGAGIALAVSLAVRSGIVVVDVARHRRTRFPVGRW
jgi:hypothetical protein